MITINARCTRELKARIEMAKAAFNKNGAETWTLQKLDQSTWKVLKCGTGEGWIR
jgi:ribosomal silencing factor RsfS